LDDKNNKKEKKNYIHIFSEHLETYKKTDILIMGQLLKWDGFYQNRI